MGDFVDSIGRGISGLVGDALSVIGGIIGTIYDWLHVFLPGPILPVTRPCLPINRLRLPG